MPTKEQTPHGPTTTHKLTLPRKTEGLTDSFADVTKRHQALLTEFDTSASRILEEHDNEFSESLTTFASLITTDSDTPTMQSRGAHA